MMNNNNKIIINTVLSIMYFIRKKDEVTGTCITGFPGELMKTRLEQIKLFNGLTQLQKNW